MKLSIPLILLSSILAHTLPPTNDGKVKLHENVEASLNSKIEKRDVAIPKKKACRPRKPATTSNKPEPSYPTASKPAELYPTTSKPAELYPTISKPAVSYPTTSSKSTVSYPTTSSKSTVSYSITTSKPAISYPTTSKPTTSYTTTSKPTTSYTTTSKPAPSNPPSSKPSGNGGLSEKDVEMLCRVNAIRAKHGKKALKMDDKLNRAARRHSQDQLDHKKMTHEGTKVKSFWDRIKNEGYKLMGGSENCAAGQGSIAQVVSDWEQSSGHFRNIVSDAECMGWGEAGNYWTQEFAKGTPCTYQTVPDCSKYH